METLFLCPRELVKKQGCGYDFTILENESTILLFLVKRENDFTIWVGREYDFTIQVAPGIAIHYSWAFFGTDQLDADIHSVIPLLFLLNLRST